MSELPVIRGLPIETTHRPPVERKEKFVILAWYAPGRFWRMRKNLYPTEEQARAAAREMMAAWTHWQIVRIPAWPGITDGGGADGQT